MTPAPSRPRRLLVPLLFVLGATVASAAILVAVVLARPGVLPGVQVAGTDVGGLDQEALRAAVLELARARGARPVEVTGAGDDVASQDAAHLGFAVDVAATTASAYSRGRQGDVLARARDHLRAFSGTTAIGLVEDVEEVALDAFVDEAAAALERPTVEGDLVFDGPAVARVDPEPGISVLHDELAAQLREQLLSTRGEIALTAPVDETPPRTDPEDVDAVLARAQRAVSAAVTLTRGDVTVTLDPAAIAGALDVDLDPGAPADDAALLLSIDPAAVDAAVGEQTKSALAVDPVDAEVALVDGAPQITPSADGFAFDPRAAAAQVLELATSGGPRTAALAGVVVPPKRSTEQAQALGITEVTGSFTTEHPCCQSRVQNIHRIADLMQNVLIEPGEVFSVNDHVGERTVENGFTQGGAISDGVFVEQVGGGVSQFATTMYNAAYFGGYEIAEHKTHSYYISRYPEGREATLNFPTVDLKVHNDSPYGILVRTSYTDTSVTVSFWGTTWVDVESITGERTRVTQPEAETRVNPELAPGETQVVSSGREGFDVTVTRIKRFPDGREEAEEEMTRYLPEPAVTEVGP